MKLITFDPLRCPNIAGTHYVKPENFFAQLPQIAEANGCLFPEYWQINALAFGMGKRIFPSLPSYLIGHNKIEMTRCFQVVAPANVPDTLILANTPSNADLVWNQMLLPFVAKIPKSARGEGVFLIETRSQWQQYLDLTPVIYAQEYLPIDRDLRLVWVGDRILTSYWRIQPAGGFHTNVAKGAVIKKGIAPRSAIRLVEQVARALGIDYGGFDVAMVGKHPYLLEFNRSFGTAGLKNLGKAHDAQLLAYLSRQWELSTEPDKPLSPRPRPIKKAG